MPHLLGASSNRKLWAISCKQDSQGDSMYWVSQGGHWVTELGAMSVVMAALKPRRRMVHCGRSYVSWHGCCQRWVKTELPQSPGNFAPDLCSWLCEMGFLSNQLIPLFSGSPGRESSTVSDAGIASKRLLEGESWELRWSYCTSFAPK